MIKTVRINKNTFTLAATGGMICTYKQQFGREYYDDLEAIRDISGESAKGALLAGYKLIWAMARAADSTIPDPDVWLGSFQEFPLLQLIPEAVALLTASFSQIKKNGDDDADSGKERMTAENLVACCLSCGMTINYINSLSIGFLINAITEYVNIKTGNTPSNNEEQQAHVRKATQADYDML